MAGKNKILRGEQRQTVNQGANSEAEIDLA